MPHHLSYPVPAEHSRFQVKEWWTAEIRKKGDGTSRKDGDGWGKFGMVSPKFFLETAMKSETLLRVRYSEIDSLGTFYNSRVLEWFECGRTELLREMGTPYTMLESRGVFLPVAESHVEYLGRARYDDLLRVVTTAWMPGKARIRCDVIIEHAKDKATVARGYTVHAFVDSSGKPIRPPSWFLSAMDDGSLPTEGRNQR
jgi:acyl-CoA thioester hydrolase